MRENKAKKSAHPVSLGIRPKHPSTPKHLFFKGYLSTWPEKKSNSLWREGGRKEKKIRGGKGRGLLSEPQMPPTAHSSTLKDCILGIPRLGGGGTPTLVPSPLCSRDPALPRGKGLLSSALASLATWRCSAVNTGGQLREGPDRKREFTKHLLHRPPGTRHRGELLSQC